MNTDPVKLVRVGHQHVLTLDALRGVAAIVVMIHHMGFWLGVEVFQHSVLAVDFFFVLSGFVIARAYEDRFRRPGEKGGSLSLRRFLTIRAIRLGPMIFLSSILAIISSLICQRPDGLQIARSSLWIVGAAAALTLPAPPSLSADTFPLNPPEWSLFFEIVANVIFAAGLYRLKTRDLFGVAGVLLIGYLIVARVNGMNVGFVWDGFGWGLLRISLPFVLGMLVNRIDLSMYTLQIPYIPAVLVFLLLAVLRFPLLQRAEWLFWTTAVGLIFPIIIVVAIIDRTSSRSGKLARFSAEISYPLYLIHYPVLVVLMPVVVSLHIGTVLAVISTGGFIAAIALIVGRVDERLRRAALRLIT